MKARELPTSKKPPRTFTLQPSAFVDTWARRPKDAIQAGMRRASADEHLAVHLDAAAKTDELHPGVAHEDLVWQTTYDVVYLHVLLSLVLTSPTDISQTLWGPAQDSQVGAEWVIPMRTPSGREAVSARFTREGIARLYDELEILSVTDNPTWDEASDDEVRQLAVGLLDGTFFATIPPGHGSLEPGEVAFRRRNMETQIRKLLTYVIALQAEGFQPAAIEPSPG